MANVLSITVNGTRANPSSTATAIGLPVFAIQDILPFTGPQPLTNAGITILTIVRMKARGTKVTHDNYLSATATATVITAAG